MAERGYGWEKLISEMLCQEYWAERGMKPYRPLSQRLWTKRHLGWRSREGARRDMPKVVEAIDKRSCQIEIWGDGPQTRRFKYIDDWS